MSTSNHSEQFSRFYKIWLIVKNNPGIKLSGIADGMATKGSHISDAISKMVNRGHLEVTGRKGDWSYCAALSNPPAMHGRGSYARENDIPGEFQWLNPTAGNPVFDECRTKSGNYWLTKLVREVRV